MWFMNTFSHAEQEMSKEKANGFIGNLSRKHYIISPMWLDSSNLLYVTLKLARTDWNIRMFYLSSHKINCSDFWMHLLKTNISNKVSKKWLKVVSLCSLRQQNPFFCSLILRFFYFLPVCMMQILIGVTLSPVIESFTCALEHDPLI